MITRASHLVPLQLLTSNKKSSVNRQISKKILVNNLRKSADIRIGVDFFYFTLQTKEVLRTNPVLQLNQGYL